MVETEFDFDKLYELVSKNYKNENEKCLICHFSIEKEEIKLSCNHQYHFKCFVCDHCQQPFKDKSYFTLHDNPVCKECHQTDTLTVWDGMTCPKCGNAPLLMRDTLICWD